MKTHPKRGTRPLLIGIYAIILLLDQPCWAATVHGCEALASDGADSAPAEKGRA